MLVLSFVVNWLNEQHDDKFTSNSGKFLEVFVIVLIFFLQFIRLGTTIDEVAVYPIPAVLYLIKNLLQVGCACFSFFFLFLIYS